jgi:hypothetical protein
MSQEKLMQRTTGVARSSHAQVQKPSLQWAVSTICCTVVLDLENKARSSACSQSLCLTLKGESKRGQVSATTMYGATRT